MQFGLMFYSIALERWRWIARFDYNLQIEHMSQPSEYGLFSWLLWGAYELNSEWHYHVGVLGYAGLEGDTIYPLIGFDYTPNEKWFFQAIFPMLYSVEYKLSSKWTLAIKGRPLKERLRAGSKEPQPRSVFNYSTMSAELNAKYNYRNRFSLELYSGCNFGGKFYIKNEHGHNAIYVPIGAAPYVGFSIDYAI